MARMQFWEHFERTPTCWLWTGAIQKDGYGVVKARGETLAHRLSWKLHRGPIPAGLVLDHICRVRRCVNPDHLEPVTHRTNTLRGIGPTAIHARRTHCPKGHPFDERNTYVWFRRGHPQRTCRACNREAARRLQARHRAARKVRPDGSAVKVMP